MPERKLHEAYETERVLYAGLDDDGLPFPLTQLHERALHQVIGFNF
jgi:hypothetical protein